MQTTILIIEDEQEIVNLLKGHLSRSFKNIITAKNGKQALDILTEVTPDLILTDIRMPGMSGIDFIVQIRAGGKDIPVIVISSSKEREDALKSIKLGVVDYLEKPFKKHDLETSIYRALEMSIRGHNLTELILKYGSDSREVKQQQKLIGLLQVLNAKSLNAG